MPIIKSAKKALKQDRKRTELRKPFKSSMKSMIKKVSDFAKKGSEETQKELAKAYSAIDKAAKKKIIHPKNAARRKANLAKAVAAGPDAPKGEAKKKAAKKG